MPKSSFTVRVERDILERLEDEARKRGMSRTKFIEHVLAEYLGVKIKEDACTPLEELRRELEDCKSRIKVLEEEIQNLKAELSKQRQHQTQLPARRT